MFSRAFFMIKGWMRKTCFHVFQKCIPVKEIETPPPQLLIHRMLTQPLATRDCLKKKLLHQRDFNNYAQNFTVGTCWKNRRNLNNVYQVMDETQPWQVSALNAKKA
ncbi:hypothetical protein NC651_009749 [Populus alba x Populus x berolinensis]|nr:hypothetical protein NC651_009749 [Populus alba x Populus x berolinensis]